MADAGFNPTFLRSLRSCHCLRPLLKAYISSDLLMLALALASQLSLNAERLLLLLRSQSWWGRLGLISSGESCGDIGLLLEKRSLLREI